MYDKLGPYDFNDDGTVTFQLLLPNKAVAPAQYGGGGLPRIVEVRVVGTFQEHISGAGANWSAGSAPELKSTDHELGTLFRYRTLKLPEGFYEYKFYVAYENAEPRYIADPCTRYGGNQQQNSAFAVGGGDERVPPLANRRPLAEWIVYELQIDDFTAGLPGSRAPLAKVTDKLDHLQRLGVNAVEFMPWTAWPGEGFSWGYNPFSYFSVAHRYTHDPARPADRLVHLKRLIKLCHERGIAVIMDGVFNHAEAGPPHRGYGYYWLYQDPADSPYVGSFEGGGYFLDLDFANRCTQEFIFDVCRYWIEEYEIDGIRFDYTLGFYRPWDRGVGLPELLSQLRAFLSQTGRKDFALILEHEWDYSSVDVVNKVGATSCWLDPYRSHTMDMLGQRGIDGRIMRLLDAGRDFGPGRVPTIYLENHDHQRFMQKVGARDQWWRTQPYMIALLTSPGAVLLHNGQEWGQMDWMPEPGEEEERHRDMPRVQPRPLRWNELQDGPGQAIFSLYRKLIQIRRAHPALCSANFHPRGWLAERETLDSDGFGVDAARGIAVYHRWAGDQRYYVALNFSDEAQSIEVPVAMDGEWEDLLSGWRAAASGNHIRLEVGPHWGHVFYRRG